MANQPLYSPQRSRGGNVPRPRRSRRPAPPGARLLAWLVGITLVVGGALVPVPAAAAPPQPAGVSAKTAYGSLEFRWDPVPGASAYRLEVSRSANFTDIVANPTTYATSWIAPTTLDLASEGQLHYRVSAYGTGTTESTRGEPSTTQVLNRDPLPAPGLLSPADGATINYPTAVTFSWSPVPGAVSYVVEYIAGEFDSSSATVVTATTTATTFVPQKPLTPGLSSGYQWRVRANYYNGSTSTSVPGATSAARGFKVEWPAAASRPTLISPENSGSNPIVSDPQLRWQPVVGAKEYRVLWGKSKDASGDIVAPFEATVTGTVYVPRTEFSNTNYYWQVVAYDANGGAGRPSEVWQFKKALSYSDAATTTGSPADVYPKPLTGTADPLDHPEIPLNELVLEWEPLPRATLYQVEVVPTNGNPRLTCLTASTSATIVASFESTGPEKDRLKGAGDCFWATKANERILPGTYTWRVRAVDYLGSATTKLQDSVADTAIVSEWSDREVSGQESRQRYFTITDPVLVNDQPNIKLDLTAFEAQKVPSLAGQPTPLLTWEPYDFSMVPGGDAAQRVGYEVTVYASWGSTTPVAVIRTPQTRLRINGVFDDNEVDEAYFASVRPFVYDTISRSWTSTTGLSYPGLGSADSFEWTKTSKPIDVSPAPQSLADGTVVLPWTPQFTTAPLDGGSRGYAITIRNSAENVVGTAGYKVDLPFVVARRFASQNDSVGSPLPEGIYTYQVAPLDANGNATRYSPRKQFTVSYPAPTGSTAVATGASQLVTWGPSTAAFKYQLQYKLANASDWKTVGNTATSVGTNPVQGGYVFTDLAPGEYRWQLRSVDTAGNVSAWSPEQTFTIGSPQLALTTADRAELPVADRALRWSPVPGASRYILEVSANQNFSPAFKYETVSTAFVPHESLTAGTAYYWRVKAIPELATTSTTRPILAASETRQFSVRTVPAAVKSPRATADGTALQVTWTPLTGAAAGTTAAPKYVIQVREKALGDDWSGARSITTQAAAASSLITGLKSATAYEARVSAVNSEGQGPWSTVVSATTASAPSAAPSSLKITQGVGSLTLSWRAPTGAGTGGSPITGYVLRYRTGSGGWTKVKLEPTTSYTLSGLKGNAQYAIELAAVNAIGEGPAATATNETLAGPGTVSSFKATRGDQSVKLTWRAPTSNGGSTVTGYVVEQRSYNAKTKKWSAWTSTTVTTTSRTVTKLVNGTKYGFRVAAKTRLATGAYSAELSVTPAGKPGASPKVTVKATKGKFTVSWKAAPNNGSALKSYVVQYSDNGKKWKTLKTTKATVLNLTTTIGKKGKKYSFRIAAKNALGTGAYSKVVQATRK